MVERESRRAKRYEVSISAEVMFKREVLQSFTKNLSETGVCLITRKPIDEGSTIDVSFFLTIDGIEDATTPSLDLRANVIWSAPSSEHEFLAGCEFLDLNDKKRQVLKKFLGQLGEEG